MDYGPYLRSPAWRTRRQQRLAVAGYRCEFVPVHGSYKPGRGSFGERCEATAGLEVHHRAYARLGAEPDDDLEVLCRFYHLVRHVNAMECPNCLDGPMIGGDDSDDDAIEIVQHAIEMHDGIKNVSPDVLTWFVSCSYCER